MLDDALLLAHEAAKSCALALVLLGSRLALPSDTATALAGDARLIATVLAPRVEIAGTLAQIAQTVAADAIAAGAAAVMQPSGRSSGQPAGQPAGRDAAPAFYDAASYLAGGLPPTTSPAKLRAGALARALLGAAEAAMLGQAFVAEAQSDFADRQSAVDARARIGAAMDGARDRIAAACGIAIYELLATAARQAGEYLVAEASELKPVVRVGAARSWPSSMLAWSLYGDPARAGELAARNRCGTPLFMPPVIEALSPDAP